MIVFFLRFIIQLSFISESENNTEKKWREGQKKIFIKDATAGSQDDNAINYAVNMVKQLSMETISESQRLLLNLMKFINNFLS